MKIDGFLKEINGIRQSMEMSVPQDGMRRSAVTLLFLQKNDQLLLKLTISLKNAEV
ncbi:hypothetical protein [Eubacterium aggregans]|uniref:hypothetical protein n=1 Tax=Eubacterium aggregans TaxID=81409 RepID=UPI003F324D06